MIRHGNQWYGIYVHIPFCHSKCYYCDFYSRADNRLRNDYVDALIKEIESRGNEITGNISTIYIGGGTPSILSEPEFIKLTDPLRKLTEQKNQEKFRIEEFTIEVNPEDVTDVKAALWKECGVNRVSMGVQSFIDSELKAIGRRHTGEDAERAYGILRRYFVNISLDLIFGLPGQTIESLGKSLDRITELSPEHVSVYSLMYEERTALTMMRDRGDIKSVEDEDSVEMFRLVNSKLSQTGYERYEISNYSKEGFRSRHNRSYWEGKPYIGFGVAAHGYDGEFKRRCNVPDIRKYVEILKTGETSELYEEEILTGEELREEMVMTRLRRREGLSLDEYKERFGEKKLQRLLNNSGKYLESGELERVGKCDTREGDIRLTDDGIMISDEIIVDLLM